MTWETKPLGSVVEVLDGKRIPVKASDRAARQGDVPYYGATGQAGWIDEPIFNESLVLLGEDGAPFFDPYKPKAYFVDGPAWVNNHAHVLRATGVDRRYLKYYLDQFNYEGFANGTTRLKLTQGAMKRIPLRFPKQEEQRRIVELVEEHLSHLDAADAALRTAALRNESLLQSVLDQATTGAATPLPILGEIQGGIQKSSRRAAPTGEGAPFLRVANVTANGLDLSDVHTISVTPKELDRLALLAGDLLVVEGNGSASQVGRAALWDGSISGCVHQNHLIRVRADPSRIVPAYLEIAWNSPRSRSALTKVASSSSGLHTLSVSKLRALSLPVPSLEEQPRIIEWVSNARSSIHRNEETARKTLARSTGLRRAVLAAAFSGRLTGFASDAEVIEETSAALSSPTREVLP